jgi:hypothetical protein
MKDWNYWAIFICLITMFVVSYKQSQTINDYSEANRRLGVQLMNIELKELKRDGKDHICIDPEVNARVLSHTIYTTRSK